jgi:hypothetical protein
MISPIEENPMKRIRTPVLAAAFALAMLSLATVALAQGSGPGGGSELHLLTLSQDSAVWDDIKITDDQLGKIFRLKASIDKQSRAFRINIRDQVRAQTGTADQTAGQPSDRAAAKAARDAARQFERDATRDNDALVKEQTVTALKKILTKLYDGKTAQFTRVQQIDLQEAGPLVVARPDVAKALSLAPDQFDQISMLVAQMSQGRDQLDTQRRELFNMMRNNFGGGGPGGGGGTGNNNANTNTPQPTPEERRAQFQQMQAKVQKTQTDSTSLKEKTIAQVGRILTPTQKKKFAALQGKPFDLTLLNYGRGPNNPFNLSGGWNGRGPGGGGPPGGGNGTPATTATASATTATGTATTATTKGAVTTKATAKAKTATSK